jgi:mannose-6-phosphate isomerase-like protein (cupin superfamily)
MGFSPRVEILPITRSHSGTTSFLSQQESDETQVAEIGTERQLLLFCHRRQTDQLMVLRGAVDLVVLENGQLRCITLREDESQLVRIPPGVPHGAINRGPMHAVMVNAVLRHGPSDPTEHRARPLSPSLQAQWQSLREVGSASPTGVGT